MVSGALSKFGKTILDQKISSAYYCGHIAEQGLLLDIHCFSNDDSLFQQDGPSTGTLLLTYTLHRSRHTVAYLRSHDRVHWSRTVVSKYCGSKSCGLLSVESITKYDVLLMKFHRHRLVETRANWLFDSFWARTHWTEWSISGQNNWWWLSMQRVPTLNFVWTIILCADDQCCYLH